jgi:hypothetical protein
MILATIDSDIANIPTNEFGLVFAGGMMVMGGGLLSAVIVGVILESTNSYANIVADSYAQGADDEEFWKGLSEEEKLKTQELIGKLKIAKGEDPGPVVAAGRAAEVVISEDLQSATEGNKETKDIGMFSDYD